MYSDGFKGGGLDGTTVVVGAAARSPDDTGEHVAITEDDGETD